MINKFQVGHFYAAVGAGKWGEWTQDLRIIAITTAQEAENLEFDIYETWFKEYEVPESMYQQMLEENNVVYHCKIVESRDPEVINEGNKDIYIFPMMINYAATSELVACKSYMWEVRTRPYLERDKFNPKTRLPVDMTALITQAIKPYIFDAITAYQNEDEIIISQKEYDMFTAEREHAESMIGSEVDTSSDEIRRQMQKMYEVIESTKAKEEKIRLTQLAADDYLRKAVRRFNENSELSNTLTARDTALRLKYNTLKFLADQVNQNLPPEDQITIPPYDELGT